MKNITWKIQTVSDHKFLYHKLQNKNLENITTGVSRQGDITVRAYFLTSTWVSVVRSMRWVTEPLMASCLFLEATPTTVTPPMCCSKAHTAWPCPQANSFQSFPVIKTIKPDSSNLHHHGKSELHSQRFNCCLIAPKKHNPVNYITPEGTVPRRNILCLHKIYQQHT